jgi:uncharacterized OsmC-like protein
MVGRATTPCSGKAWCRALERTGGRGAGIIELSDLGGGRSMGEVSKAVELEQVERYRFSAQYPDQPFGPLVVDEAIPTGGSAGPGPVLSLATAVGHCMSSTLVNTLERAHVPVQTIHTVVEVEVGRNERGRLRVQRLSLQIRTAPLRPEDQPRFDHCVAIFEDFCTVSGAVRGGIPIDTKVGPGSS